jgi:signal transduction histidine kinase
MPRLTRCGFDAAQFDGPGPKAARRNRLAAMRAVCAWWFCISAALASGTADRWPESAGSNLISLADLRGKLSQQGRTIESFRAEGVVCAVVRGRNLLALQDSSGCVLLEAPALDETIQAGEWVAVTADHCALTRNRFGLQLGTAPVVNNDGHHPAVFKSGKVFLEAGWQPIRVTWFNGRGASALQVDYEGPGVPRQKVPPAALRRTPLQTSSPEDFQPGLEFAAYTGEWYFALPDFQRLAPVARGVTTDFDLRYSVRQENAALAFSGYILAPATGIYTFYVNSDDGSYLYAGNPAAACQITAIEHKILPAPRRLKEALAGGDDHVWAELEGEVTFVGQNEQELDLELTGQGERGRVEVVEAASLLSTNLLHRRVRAVGILEASSDSEQSTRARLIVPGPDQLEILAPFDETISADTTTNKTLTTAEEIRHLSRADAGRGLPAKIKGVVTWSSPFALVLQDSTGGIYILYAADDWAEQPRVGDCWEIEGKTDPGDFSPVIYAREATYQGSAALPEPIRPTRDQLLNGSLDAQRVELRGALTEVSPSEMTLLTSEGKIKIMSMDDHPLPQLPAPPSDDTSYVDSIVRIRGCLTARWDKTTHQVSAGQIFLSPGTVEIEELAPKHPFALATRRAEDLTRFDPGAGVLQRTKVKGQIVLTRPGEYCLQDGSSGLRLRTKEPLTLQPGDVVEAVGFPQAGGPSPILQESRVRSVGRAAVPPPVPIAAMELLNHSHDSTRVKMEAMLLSDRTDPTEWTLELQAGQSHFIARLQSGQPGAQPLAAGSRLQLTGVYLSSEGEQASGSLDAFELWLTNPADIRLMQEPPWWTLKRALTIVAVLSGVLAVALVWITLLRRQVERRTAQLQKQIEERQWEEQRRVMEQERTRVAQDLHDELGAGLTEMGLLGDLVKNPAVPAPEKQQYLSQLTDTARSLVTSLDEIVWAVDPRYDSVADLASYYALFAQRFLDLAGVACRPHIPASFPEYPLDPKGRHGLFLAFKEALNNVVRHSGAAEVRLKIEVGAGELLISVADNGHGFNPANGASGGEGLQGMRRRLEHLGGSCAIRSRPGAGTEVELRLPVGNHVL